MRVKIHNIMLMGCFLLSLTSVSFAVEQPVPMHSDTRLYRIAYQQNNVIPLQGVALKTTQVILGHDEHIVSVNIGDPTYWWWHVSKPIPYLLSLKPTRYPSNTNMQVVTLDASGKTRFYFFHLIASKPHQTTHAMYAVRFYYPALKKAAILAKHHARANRLKHTINPLKNPQHYHWDYTFNGAVALRPLHVFDDGTFTYMEFRQNQVIPAIFAVDTKKGTESVVNYRRQGRYIVIQQMAPQFTLRAGKQIVASVFNQRLIHQLKYDGEV